MKIYNKERHTGSEAWHVNAEQLLTYMRQQILGDELFHLLQTHRVWQIERMYGIPSFSITDSHRQMKDIGIKEIKKLMQMEVKI